MQVFDFLLAFFTGFPACFYTLISPDMYILTREKSTHLIHNIFEQCQGSIITRTNHIPKHSPTIRNLIFPRYTSQLRIRSQHGGSVSRQINFWDHHYITLLCISNDFFYLLLRIIPSVRLSICRIIPASYVTTYNRIPSPSTNLSQLGMFLDFNSPTLVVSKMPMKHVQLMQSQ